RKVQSKDVVILSRRRRISKEVICMYYVYILTNKTDKVMYIGVTNDIVRRVYEHRNHMIDGFTAKYNVTKLVYVESAPDVRDAIQREKQLKGWTRAKKNALVETVNPKWEDMWETIL
ncbi:MAG: GIY-YIG nuclease family protein, partial [Candidatus Fimenecus sp.]